jgi:transcriptional accessory protein Tex/SPT6
MIDIDDYDKAILVSGDGDFQCLAKYLHEQDKLGRDPRQKIQVFEFDKNVQTIDDLREGMELPGIINNITNFGCFVDIGVKENGLPFWLFYVTFLSHTFR